MNPAGKQMKAAFARNEAVCGQILEMFQLLSNKTRFRIICLLAQGEFCVSDIVEVVGESQMSNISQQLKMLAVTGLIERRREKQQILYTLKDKQVRALIQFLQKQYACDLHARPKAARAEVPR